MIFFITVLAFTPSLMATFVGFNFDKGMPLFIFYEMLFIEIIALILLGCIIILDNRYHLFKKFDANKLSGLLGTPSRQISRT